MEFEFSDIQNPLGLDLDYVYKNEDAENSRIAAIADELDRLCAIHEAQLRDSQADVSHFEVEQRAAEQMAKAGGCWIPMMDIFD